MITTSSGWSITFDGEMTCGSGRAGPYGEASVRFTSCNRCGVAQFYGTGASKVPADVEHAVNRETKRFTYLRCNGCGHGLDCCACEADERSE